MAEEEESRDERDDGDEVAVPIQYAQSTVLQAAVSSEPWRGVRREQGSLWFGESDHGRKGLAARAGAQTELEELERQR